MPQTYPAPTVRPIGAGASQTYIAGTGAVVATSAGPSDPVGVIGLSVALLPSASWKVAATFIGRINTYYGSGKDATVLAAMGLTTAAADPGVVAPSALFGFTGNLFWYHVLPADLVAEVASLTALVTSGNIAKGGNP